MVPDPPANVFLALTDVPNLVRVVLRIYTPFSQTWTRVQIKSAGCIIGHFRTAVDVEVPRLTELDLDRSKCSVPSREIDDRFIDLPYCHFLLLGSVYLVRIIAPRNRPYLSFNHHEAYKR